MLTICSLYHNHIGDEFIYKKYIVYTLLIYSRLAGMQRNESREKKVRKAKCPGIKKAAP